MNNFTFGNGRYQYYETICGGSGAGADFDGTDAVHTHMTNSRLTDPEVLEWRFPFSWKALEFVPIVGVRDSITAAMALSVACVSSNR
jgi:N-methylhydantoinase B/oxoprolinase/acetone carboxylase alpha subunit